MSSPITGAPPAERGRRHAPAVATHRIDLARRPGHLARPMNLRLAVFCDEARERPDGRLDLAGIFDELAAPGFPAMQERMTVALVLEWAPDEQGRQPLRADLVDDQGTRVLTIQGHTDVAMHADQRRPARTRLILPLERVIFPHDGPYHLDLIAAGDTTRACSLHVMEHAGEP